MAGKASSYHYKCTTMSTNRTSESNFNCTSTFLDKHDEFITGFKHSCRLQQAEALVKTNLEAAILLVMYEILKLINISIYQH